MNEAEWLKCTDPTQLLALLRGKMSERKLRLFSLACCHRINRLLSNRESQEAVEFVERHVEKGVVRRKGRATIERAAYKAHVGSHNGRFLLPEGIERAKCLIVSSATAAACWALNTNSNDAAHFSSSFSVIAVGWEALVASTTDSYANFPDSFKRPEQEHQTALIRCIIGNPIRPIIIKPNWLTWNDGTVHRIAQSIYDDRVFDRMPILADALTDAGCDNADILSHCRSEGPHVRGCWVVDQLLGKE